jgi:hypothetical protein
MIEITGFTKANGPLTKRISLGPDGKPVSDGSACVMAAGQARRLSFASITEFAEHIGTLASNEAIALGALRPGLPDQVEIVTKAKLQALNGAAAPNVNARTAGEITYRPKQPGVALLDFDTKGMPEEITARVAELGGFWGAVVSVVPEIRGAGRLMRASTSAGLFRTDTGERFAGSNGVHLYLLVADAADIERFLKTLHVRCWNAGLGWLMVGRAGQLLERSILDRMVGAPERLVFEGAPVLEPSLGQDQDSRRPEVRDGETLDTLVACPPLTVAEQARYDELRARETHCLAPERAKARDAFIKKQAKALADRTGMDIRIALRVVARQCDGVLMPDIELPFDNPDLAGTTVRDVLSDPARFEGATLADPLEGVSYGRCKARIMRRADGPLFINSFAHGHSIYELKLDAAAVRAAIEKAPKEEGANIFVQMALQAVLADDELENLFELTAKGAGVGKMVIKRKLKAAQREHEDKRAQEERTRRLAERRDPRPQIKAPQKDAPFLPQMVLLNDVLGKSGEPVPPALDIDGEALRLKLRLFPAMHLLSTAASNPGDDH